MSQQELVDTFFNEQNISALTTESIAVHLEGSIVGCNENFLNSFGYSQDEILGLNLFNFFPKIYREILDCGDSEGELTLETLCVRKDSSTFPATVLCKNVIQNSKKLTALIVRDETERKSLENELLKTTVFQRAILHSSSFAIISTDFNGLIKTFNRGAEILFGYKQEEVIDQIHLPELYSEEEIKERANELSRELQRDIDAGLEVFLANLQKSKVDESEWTGLTKEGRKFFASLTVTTLKDNLNEISGYLFTALDITDKKEAQAEIFDKSQMLNGIVSNMPVFIFKVNSAGDFTQSIGSGLKNLQLKNENLTGKNIYTFFPNKMEKVSKAFEGNSISFIETTQNSEWDRHYEYYLFPDLTNKGGIIGFALDITEKILSEKKLEESAENLEKINNELNQFAYIVSHDLKTPLRAISNLSEWIEEDIKDSVSKEGVKNLNLLKDRVKRMQDLIDGILEYTKIGRINTDYEDIDVKVLIEETIRIVAVPSEFSINIENNIPQIKFNRICLEMVFSNLIENAVKFHDKKKGKIDIQYEKLDGYHQFSIVDDGPGIHPEHHERIFQIFQTLKPKDIEFNTGVGLTIVKKIITEFGGQFDLKSDGKNGSNFTFTIPIDGQD